MNVQQLRIVSEAVRRDLNLTEVARVLNTAQSGVSKHIADLEKELGGDIFIRRGKRIVALTPFGRELVQIAERIVHDLGTIRMLATELSGSDVGTLRVATTHTQARYALPSVISRFRTIYPKVRLELREGGPAEIASLLLADQIDIGIATEALAHLPDVASFDYYGWHHAVICPTDHPLAQRSTITLQEVAEFSLITYSPGYTGRARVDEAFAAQGLTPNVVVSAIDADVIKTYVELGLGVGIIAEMAYDAEKDRGLRLLPSRHLFEANTTRIVLRKSSYLREFTSMFVRLCVPELTAATIKKAAMTHD